MVFFDWGKPDDPRGRWRRSTRSPRPFDARPDARLQLSGHTDRSGSVAVNRARGLEAREAVREELEKRGVPRNAMSVVSFGEERPLVPTEDGVREVQNRRVVIAFEE